jgi:FAD/FMN-containing dehydrogenase
VNLLPGSRGRGATGVAGSPDRYRRAVAALQTGYAGLPPGAPVRLAKNTSNLFRPRATVVERLDVAEFRGVIELDAGARWADVAGMTTYEELVDATLPYGLMPLVVPQLKTITLGGAVSGVGIESTSFRNGTPHESLLEMDILTGDGRVVTARPGGEHRELFFGFPNSYGSLGYALRLRIQLEPVHPFVALTHHRYPDAAALASDLSRLVDEPGVDFLDGVAFGPEEFYLTVGRFTDRVGRVSDYTLTEIYYRSIQRRGEDALTVRDYLWRWDTDWFWCSRAFGVSRPWVRRLLGRRWLRSDTYWRLVALEQRYQVKARYDRLRGRPDRELVVQDVEVPVQRLAEFLGFLERQTGIRPVWVCPLRQRDPEVTWSLYPLEPGILWVNVGFWSTVALPPGESEGFHNRAVEREVSRLGGRKSLYSTSFYEPAEFWRYYGGGGTYEILKKSYDPDARLLDLYAKTVGRR